MRNSMELACIQRLGLEIPFTPEERSIYGQGGGLEHFRQLGCNPSVQCRHSSAFGLDIDSAGALEMTDCPSFDKLGTGGVYVTGAHHMDNSNLFALSHFSNFSNNSHQMQPIDPIDTNITTSMPDLWSVFCDASSWTELCSLSSDELMNQSLPPQQQNFVAGSTALPHIQQQQPPSIILHSTPMQHHHHAPPCILPHSDATHGQQSQPCAYFGCGPPQEDQIHSRGNSRRTASEKINWQISEVLGGAVKSFGGTFLDDDISPVTVPVISSEDSSETAVLNSFVRNPHVPAHSVPGDFQSTDWISEGPLTSAAFRATNSWTSGVSKELRTGSATAVTAAVSHSMSISHPLMSSLDTGRDMETCSLVNKRQKVRDTSSNGLDTIRNYHAMPSLSPSSCMPSILGNQDSDSRRSSPSLEFAGERFKDIETSFPPRLPRLSSAVYPLEEGLGSNIFSEQKPQGFKSGRKQTATSIEPQSVAARHRRKRISERVRILEGLIPGGSKLDTASMLDESIDYVKFLQLQVHLLESLDSPGHGTGWGALDDSGVGEGALAGLPSNAPKGSVPARSSGCPLILSEVLQQQLFKQKLCLVSLSQVSSGRNSEK